jgi:hypothetical protein
MGTLRAAAQVAESDPVAPIWRPSAWGLISDAAAMPGREEHEGRESWFRDHDRNGRRRGGGRDPRDAPLALPAGRRRHRGRGAPEPKFTRSARGAPMEATGILMPARRTIVKGHRRPGGGPGAGTALSRSCSAALAESFRALHGWVSRHRSGPVALPLASGARSRPVGTLHGFGSRAVCLAVPRRCGCRGTAQALPSEREVTCRPARAPSTGLGLQLLEPRPQRLVPLEPLGHVAEDGHHPLDAACGVLEELDGELHGELPAILVERWHGEALPIPVPPLTRVQAPPELFDPGPSYDAPDSPCPA